MTRISMTEMRKLNGRDKQKLSYYAERYMTQQTGTKSLKKLNELFRENDDQVVKYAISAYLFFTDFAEKAGNEFKFPELNELYLNFKEQAFTSVEGKNKYRDALEVLYFDYDKKELSKNNKDKFRKDLLESLEKTQLTLNYVSKENSLKYSNLYNFLYKEENSKLSLTNAAKLKMFFKGLMNNNVKKV